MFRQNKLASLESNVTLLCGCLYKPFVSLSISCRVLLVEVFWIDVEIIVLDCLITIL